MIDIGQYIAIIVNEDISDRRLLRRLSTPTAFYVCRQPNLVARSKTRTINSFILSWKYNYIVDYCQCGSSYDIYEQNGSKTANKQTNTQNYEPEAKYMCVCVPARIRCKVILANLVRTGNFAAVKITELEMYLTQRAQKRKPKKVSN